jgi:hypothetical protein
VEVNRHFKVSYCLYHQGDYLNSQIRPAIFSFYFVVPILSFVHITWCNAALL